MELVKDLNQRLEDYYGKDIVGHVNWRIVWSTSQLEKRFGTFIKETEAGLYLGEWTGVKEVPKYPMNPDCWILERVQPNVGNPDLVDSYSYEPTWVFKPSQQPVWLAIEYIIKCWEFAVSAKQSQRDADYIEAKRMELEKKDMHDYLKAQTPAFHGKLSDHEAIVVPSNYSKG